ncbi:hypothetical protein QYF36_021023 [Acer negundo]|nr:hypothetical protein QYF36_021023 [Acer negundo]
MDWSLRLSFRVFLILAAAIDGARANAMVTGTVICDQCKDGQISLFDYPISGVRVTINCADINGQTTMSKEVTTNWFGSYSMSMDGSPNLSNCQAKVSGSSDATTGCTAAAGPAQNLKLSFNWFGLEIYSVDSLLTQPDHPMSFCPQSATPVSAPRTPVNPLPTPVTPVTPTNPVSPPSTPVNPPTQDSPPRSPPFRIPPMPRFPPLSPLPPLPPMPPMPFVEASACPHQNWTMPEYKCYWRVLNPDTEVALIFGPIASRRYGTGMTLWQGLQGRGDPYRTLLREATTALLNSYNSVQFPYNTVAVVTHMNQALMGSPRSVLLTALRFMRANSGSPNNVSCKFTTCKLTLWFKPKFSSRSLHTLQVFPKRTLINHNQSIPTSDHHCASLSEWANARHIPNGWCARSGQGRNPYVLSADPSGSSSGSAISVAANMVAVSLGTETDGSILCPSSSNSVVGIKPTVGLTSRDGVVPITHRQDTIGPICRTVADAVYVLDAIVGFDHNDEATSEASRYIPPGGYIQFLKPSGLKGKRLGIVRDPFFTTIKEPEIIRAFEHHFQTLRQQGAVLVDNLKILGIDAIMNPFISGEGKAMDADLKLDLNKYLEGLVVSPVRSLADVIEFNKFEKLEMTEKHGQQGKASLSEWANARLIPSGWCARSGQGRNPYVLSADPCGSSSGSAISVAANMAAVSLGTETDGSILCPSSYNSVVGIKPTVGLTSRDGVVPITHRQDTIGPICRTVADAVYVLDAIVGVDHNDKATREASKYIPVGGYIQFLKPFGLKGKRLGIVRDPFFTDIKEPGIVRAFEHHFQTLRQQGAVFLDNLKIVSIDAILNPLVSGEGKAMDADLKLDLNKYLEGLVVSPVRSLADVIEFNNKFAKLEMTEEYGQQGFLDAQKTDGINAEADLVLPDGVDVDLVLLKAGVCVDRLRHLLHRVRHHQGVNYVAGR